MPWVVGCKCSSKMIACEIERRRAALDLTGAESVKAYTREAPRGRRSISQATKMQCQKKTA